MDPSRDLDRIVSELNARPESDGDEASDTARLDRWLGALLAKGGSDLLLVPEAPVCILHEGGVRNIEAEPLSGSEIEAIVLPALTTPFARLPDGVDVLDLLAGAGFTALALSPDGAERLAGLDRPDRAAILLGAEGPGLPNDVLARARTITIPMAPGWDSLNVATAGAVVLHELARRP